MKNRKKSSIYVRSIIPAGKKSIISIFIGIFIVGLVLNITIGEPIIVKNVYVSKYITSLIYIVLIIVYHSLAFFCGGYMCQEIKKISYKLAKNLINILMVVYILLIVYIFYVNNFRDLWITVPICFGFLLGLYSAKNDILGVDTLKKGKVLDYYE